MTKYLIYAEDEKKPVRKMKHAYEAIDFAEDVRNLQRYGCMSVVKVVDDEGRYTWNSETSVWEKAGD